MVILPYLKIKSLDKYMEEFRIVFEDYEVSNLGNVRRKLKNGDYRVIKGSILNRGGGYRYFQIHRNNTRTNLLFHHLVAQAFISERPEGKVIDHIDRNSLNNNLSNLRYITQTENMRNTEKYKEEIPADVENRQSLVCKLYRENNKEKIKVKKKEYYENNKGTINEKVKNNKIEVKCDECNNNRTITICTYNRNKRLGVNICKCCSSKTNLLKINKKTYVNES